MRASFGLPWLRCKSKSATSISSPIYLGKIYLVEWHDGGVYVNKQCTPGKHKGTSPLMERPITHRVNSTHEQALCVFGQWFLHS